MPRHIALVGCGFTGTSAFFQLVDRFPVLEITIFEKTGEFGPGYAYNTEECRDYLINNTTDTMCLTPSHRRAFLDWLRLHPELVPNANPRDHLPRTLFGEFLKEVFGATLTVAAIKGIKVHLIPFEARTIHEDAEGRVHIGSTEGETVVDAAILTTGRCPDLDVYGLPRDGGGAKYYSNHVMSAELDALPLDATAHVLGASLSAYDVINRLFSPDTGCAFAPAGNGDLVFEPGPNLRRVVLCSRSGRLKCLQSKFPMLINRTWFTAEALRDGAGDTGYSLAEVADVIRREADEHSAAVDWDMVSDPYRNCRSHAELNARAADLLELAIVAATSKDTDNFLVDFFADAQIDIWDAFANRFLKPESELLYRTKLETAALSYIAPCPVPTAEKMLALFRVGRLSVIKGVREIKLSNDGAHYEIMHDFGRETASVLINATGAADRDVNSDKQPDLIKCLKGRGLLKSYKRNGMPSKGASVDMNTFCIEGASNIYLANMLLWGPGFFTSSAYMMATVVERLLTNLFASIDEQRSI